MPNSLASRTIIVEGVDKSTSEDLLRMMFENKRRTGGGEIEDVDYQPNSGRANITFIAEEGLWPYSLCNSIAFSWSVRNSNSTIIAEEWGICWTVLH